MELKLTIPLPPITKKNHLQIFRNPKTGAPFVTQSKQYKDYEKSALYYLSTQEYELVNYPVNVACKFYMKTRRRVDLVNLEEALLDILVKGGVLEDDNRDIVGSMDLSCVLYDKVAPRTEIIITPLKDYGQWKQGE